MTDYVVSSGAAPPVATGRSRSSTQKANASDELEFGDLLKAKQKENLKHDEEDNLRSQVPVAPSPTQPDYPKEDPAPAENAAETPIVDEQALSTGRPSTEAMSQADGTLVQPGMENTTPVVPGEGEVVTPTVEMPTPIATGITADDAPGATTLNPTSPEAVFSEALANSVGSQNPSVDPSLVAPVVEPVVGQQGEITQPLEPARPGTAPESGPGVWQAESRVSGKVVEQGAESTEQASDPNPSTNPGGSSGAVASTGSEQTNAAIAPAQAAQSSATAAVTTAQRVDLVQQLVAQMDGALQAGRTTMKIHLNPAELGAIELNLVSGANGISVSMVADQASTGKLLENQLSQLRQSLAEAGIQLANLNISQQNMANQQQSATFSQNSQRGAAAYVRRLDRADELENEVVSARARSVLTASAVDYRI